MTRTVPIPAGSDSLVLTDQNLPATPVRIICSVRSPAVQTVIGASVVDGTLSATGFSVHFTGETPSGAYLDYTAAFE